MFANFIHPVTGEKRQVKIGLSWTLFFFGEFFGIPFFIRKSFLCCIFSTFCSSIAPYLVAVPLPIF